MRKGAFIREIIISIQVYMVFLGLLTLAPIQEVAAGELNSPRIVSYVWNDDKEPLYASPSHDSEPPLAFLEAGERVERLAVVGSANSHVTIYQREMEEFFAEDYLSIWTEPATWLKVRWKGQEGYMLDTYLLHFPPQHDPQQAFIIEYYLKDLSPTTSDLFIGNTEKFCEQHTISYGNGMTCILTDYGPCEQYGHMQYILGITHTEDVYV